MDYTVLPYVGIGFIVFCVALIMVMELVFAVIRFVKVIEASWPKEVKQATLSAIFNPLGR